MSTEQLCSEAAPSLTNLGEEPSSTQSICKKCCKQFTSPKILPCLHIFCLHCIEICEPPREWTKGHGKQCTSCETCGAFHILPRGSASFLPDAIFISEDLTEFQYDVVRKSTVTVCPKHNDPLKVYCETCNEVICRDCTISKEHSGHRHKLVTECFTEHQQELESELQQVENRMKDLNMAIIGITSREMQVVDRGEEIKEAIETHTQRVIEHARRSEQRSLEQLDRLIHQKIELLTRQREQAEKVHKQLETCKEMVKQRLNELKNEQILMEKERMIGRMKHLVQMTDPTTFIPMEKADLEYVPLCTTEKGIGEVRCEVFAKAVINIPSCPSKTRSTATLSLTSRDGLAFSLPSSLVTGLLYSPNDKNNQVSTCDIKESQPGEFNISFTPSTRGQHQLVVRVGGIDVLGTPSVISVVDRPLKILTGIKGPRGMAICENGDIVVVESNTQCVSIFNKNGKKVKSFKGVKKNDSFVYPRGVATTVDGCILVTDNQRLQKITFRGSCVYSVCTCEKERKLNWPIGIAVHPRTRQVFVTDSDDNRILVFDDDLEFSHALELKGDERFNRPRFLAFDKNESLYVADYGNHCITKLKATGEFVKRFGSKGSLPGELFLPYGVAIDDKMVYVVEEGNSRVSIFDTEGNFIDCFGAKGDGEREFNSPCCIVANSSGSLYISDTSNDRIILF